MAKKRNYENDEAYKNFRLEDYLPSIDKPKREEVPSEPKEEQCTEETSLFPMLEEPDTSVAFHTDGQSEWEDKNDEGDADIAVVEVDTPVERVIARRISSKQRRLSLEGYRSTYLQVPKIADRKPVFVSREVRDGLDEIVRRLGGRGMSVSGLVENIARQYFDTYANDIDQWRKL